DGRSLLGAEGPTNSVDDHQVVLRQEFLGDDAGLIDDQRAGDRRALLFEPGLEVRVREVALGPEDADLQAVAESVVADVDVVDQAVAVVVDEVAAGLEALGHDAHVVAVAVAGWIAVAVAVPGWIAIAVAVAITGWIAIAVAVAITGWITIAIA